MVKKSKNFKKSRNISKNHTSLTIKIKKKIIGKKKCYSLSFPIIGGRALTKALQSSLFHNPGRVP